MQLQITKQQLLATLLQQHHRELLWELARTDHAELKSALRNEVQILEGLLEKVQVCAATAG